MHLSPGALRAAFAALPVCLASGCWLGAGNAGTPQPIPQCTTSADCGADWQCTAQGACVASSTCSADTCTDAQICNPRAGQCESLAERCAAAPDGCSCFIVGSGGRLAAAGPAQILLRPGEQLAVRAMLAVNNGPVLAAQGFTARLADATSFSLDAGGIIAGASAGTTTLTVSFDGLATCDAQLVNLGAASTVRVTAIDAASGAPVPNAEVAIDLNGDGVADGGMIATDSTGVAVTGATPAAPYNVTVFSAGHAYVTLAALPADALDVVVPLPATSVSGVHGSVDFSPYQAQMLGGVHTALSLAMVSSPLELGALSHFSLASLLGGPEPQVDCNATPSAAGCYRLYVPGDFISIDVNGPLQPGLQFEFSGAQINAPKPSFAVTERPGRRFVWSLGLETQLSDASGLLNVMSERAQPTCDNCVPNPIGPVLRGMQPMFVESMSAVRGNLDLQAASAADWQTARASGTFDARFADLSSSRGGLPLQERTSRYSVLAVPALPSDPWAAAGTSMQGVIALTGALTPNGGLVLLGVGAGFDTQDPGETPDSHIDPTTVCWNTCSPEARDGEVAADHIALFHAAPHAGLDNAPQRTVLIAMPTESSLTTVYRAVGFVIDGPLATGAVNTTNRTYPTLPTPPDGITGRTVQTAASADVDLQRFSITGAAGTGPGWVIYSDAAAHTIALPAVPASLTDPLSAPSVRFAATGVALSAGEDYPSLATSHGDGLATLVPHTRAFFGESVTLPVQ